MSGLMNMALDDIIKQKQTGRTRAHRPRRGTNNRFVPRGTRGGGSSYGVVKHTSRGTRRRAPYGQRGDNGFSEETVWEHDLYEDEEEEELEEEEEEAGFGGGGGAGRRGSIQTGVKVTVSNLEYSVSEKDLASIMGRAGTVKKAVIKYDRSGRSEGNAEVFFATRNDAAAAVNQFNGVEIDGKVVRLSLGGGQSRSSDGPSGLVVSARVERNTRVSRPARGFGRGSRGFGRGRGSRGGRGGRGGRKSFGEKVTAEDLDKELESYNNMNDA